ncbi:MAG: hypothetical protein EP341_03165 [Sphingomonadales bacterium]|nr:MAG: hypothetical protein EP341_03165 [Sphingomonadales bacterium]
MAKKELPDPKLLRKLLRYDPETGKLFWRERPRDIFTSDWYFRSWNTRFSGQEAFTAIDRDGYNVGKLLQRQMKAHRIIWCICYGEWPEDQIDHENGNRLDNRIENLREVSCAENLKNRKMPSTNKSGIMGVSWSNTKGKWRAEIGVDGKHVTIGLFDTAKAASKARKAAEAAHNFHPNHGR